MPPEHLPPPVGQVGKKPLENSPLRVEIQRGNSASSCGSHLPRCGGIAAGATRVSGAGARAGAAASPSTALAAGPGAGRAPQGCGLWARDSCPCGTGDAEESSYFAGRAPQRELR